VLCGDRPHSRALKASANHTIQRRFAILNVKPTINKFRNASYELTIPCVSNNGAWGNGNKLDATASNGICTCLVTFPVHNIFGYPDSGSC